MNFKSSGRRPAETRAAGDACSTSLCVSPALSSTMKAGPLPLFDLLLQGIPAALLKLDPYSGAEIMAFLPHLLACGCVVPEVRSVWWVVRACSGGHKQAELGGQGGELSLCRSYLAVDMAAVWRDAQRDAFDDDARADQSGLLFELAPTPKEQLQTVLEAIGSASKVCMLLCQCRSVADVRRQRKLEILENPYFHADVSLALCVLLKRLNEQQLSIGSVVKLLARTRCLSILLSVARNCPERLDVVVAALVAAAPKHPDAAQAL
jgi:hypothetical protein